MTKLVKGGTPRAAKVWQSEMLIFQIKKKYLS